MSVERDESMIHDSRCFFVIIKHPNAKFYLIRRLIEFDGFYYRLQCSELCCLNRLHGWWKWAFPGWMRSRPWEPLTMTSTWQPTFSCNTEESRNKRWRLRQSWARKTGEGQKRDQRKTEMRTGRGTIHADKYKVVNKMKMCMEDVMFLQIIRRLRLWFGDRPNKNFAIDSSVKRCEAQKWVKSAFDCYDCCEHAPLLCADVEPTLLGSEPPILFNFFPFWNTETN